MQNAAIAMLQAPRRMLEDINLKIGALPSFATPD
jgi:hypothetical protein